MKTIQEIHNLYTIHNIITTDSRNVQKGAIYFALKGENFDGNEFIQSALDNGASYAISDNKKLENQNEKIIIVENVLQTLQELAKFHRQNLKIPVIGITGTNGKTTTKELIKTVLEKQYNVFATKGNLNNHIGVPISILSITKETQIAIIEMGANHKGEIAQLSKIAQPNYGIITNIGKAHLEGFGSFDGVVKTKKELYDYIKKQNGTIFVNHSDKLLLKMASNNNSIYYNDDNLLFENLTINPYLNFYVKINKSSTINIKSKIIGRYNIDNMLAAIAIGKYFKINNKNIKLALTNFTPNNNRSQLIQSNSNSIIMDAYNANPSSMNVAIDNFNDINSNNKIIILGDMLELGENSDAEHKTICTKLNNMNFNKIILVGNLFKKNSTYPHFLTFNNTIEATEYIKKNPINNAYVLLKGSRKIQLEELIKII
ncbi:MAG: hypothetical protein A2X12_06655 [Bacteroidetes bacterium GWE2_29_8]|nr:MAG: hypothetical protein A2X12_06655 [Bacteroidetes bacterium GWE2_29_8]OFY22844.1 MAG: hypothetical protein A2X02_07165 [Bacteroidetes bacterium GWF2_29_10]